MSWPQNPLYKVVNEARACFFCSKMFRYVDMDGGDKESECKYHGKSTVDDTKGAGRNNVNVVGRLFVAEEMVPEWRKSRLGSVGSYWKKTFTDDVIVEREEKVLLPVDGKCPLSVTITMRGIAAERSADRPARPQPFWHATTYSSVGAGHQLRLAKLYEMLDGYDAESSVTGVVGPGDGLPSDVSNWKWQCCYAGLDQPGCQERVAHSTWHLSKDIE